MNSNLTPYALFMIFLAGDTLPPLSPRKLRAMLDVARDAMLRLANRQPPPPEPPVASAEADAAAKREVREVIDRQITAGMLEGLCGWSAEDADRIANPAKRRTGR